MELVFESTKEFKKDLNKFEKKDQGKIIEKLNCYCSTLLNDSSIFYSKVYKPYIFMLKDNFEQSLYSMRISIDIRVILAVDEDPLFNQILITLFRVVKHDELKKAFKSIGESLL
ncbi:conserved hypothetical protein [Clostridiaceae bacterium BL-3]|nr:conserved hypothetical protein [Clostridiaceae bacterium BL-3]